MNRIDPPPRERLTWGDFISPTIGLAAAILILWLGGALRCERARPATLQAAEIDDYEPRT